MHKFRTFYYENKEKILKIVGIVALVLILINLLNYNIKEQKKDEMNTNIEGNNSTESSHLPATVVSSGGTVSKKVTKSNVEIIGNFINECNNQNVDNAYQMLSQDCKNLMFPTVEDFYNKYLNEIFTEKKSYDLEAWFTSGVVTYKVKFLQDIMSQGKISDEYIQDYYTVITENEEKKLNINNFIRKEKIEKSSERKDVEITINERNYYINYVEYVVNIKNNNEKTVIIDSKDNTETVYLTDKNGVKYNWYGHEIANNLLILESGQDIELNIKFNKMFNPKRKDKSITFSDIQIEGEENKEKIQVGV